MIINRRNALIGGLASLLAAPAIVRAGSLMPVRAVPRLILRRADGAVLGLVRPLEPSLGQIYYDLLNACVSVWDGSSWIACSPGIASELLNNRRLNNARPQLPLRR